MTVGQLLELSRAILGELRRRKVIRTGNAPIGDYAEWLVQKATAGELKPNSHSSWDVLTPERERLQVKSRTVTDPRVRGERQLSVFRSWDFDSAVIVLFDDRFRVWKASRLTVATVQGTARRSDHVNGDRVEATDELLDQGEDWSLRLRDIEG
jgi:hypothetical protein